MSAIIQVQNAGHWVTRDALSAQMVHTGGAGLVTMNWTDWGGRLNSVTYILEQGNLQRLHSQSGGALSKTLVARSIDPTGTGFAWNATLRKLTFTVTATVDELTHEKRVYRITPRAGFVR
jgi:hypothetical protein